MNAASRMCLIGDVIVDVMMTTPVKMRLGGIIHAARACCALGLQFDLRFVSPDYLEEHVVEFARQHGAHSVERIGRVMGAPNVVVIKEATEAGSQGYEYLLRDCYRCEFADDLASLIPVSDDVLIFPGSYDLRDVLRSCAGKGKVAVDIANWDGDIKDLAEFDISTAITSTSSSLFLRNYKGDVAAFSAACRRVSGTLLFKENRGGSRIFSAEGVWQIGAQLRPIAHSVGVGDCYNVAFLSKRRTSEDLVAGNFAARVAAEYAATTYPDEFFDGVQAILALNDTFLDAQQGVSIPWERRANLSVYIAAPDFDYVDRSVINSVADALKYHNLRPRLPVRENGQAQPEDSIEKKTALFAGDMALLDECQLLVAVILDSDPGTLIELGLAAGMGKPTIVYDPHGLASNVMLLCLPNAVCKTLDELMSAVFTELAKVL